MLKVRILALLAVLALSLTMLPAVASAQSLPYIVIGTATINGQAAPVGTLVTALIAGKVVASETISERGKLPTLQVKAGDGTEITFTLDALLAEQTATWERGDRIVLDLTANALTGGDDGGPVIPGRQGRIGPAGAAGAQGPAGPQGPAGAAGSDGADGADGTDGTNGAAGAQGSQGLAGSAGGGGGPLGIIALILAIIALVGVGAVYYLGRQQAA